LAKNTLIESEVGTDLHWIIEYIIIRFLYKKGLNSFYEVIPNIFTGKTTIDTLIIRDGKFKKEIENNQNVISIPPQIKIINIDYYFGSDLNKIRKKTLRNYQGKEKFLIIVVLSTTNKIKYPTDIPYRKNVKILSYKDFSKFIGLNGTFQEQYKAAINLARRYHYNQARQELRNLSSQSAKLIQEKFPYQQEKYEQYLMNKNLCYLLNSSTNGRDLSKWIKFP